MQSIQLVQSLQQLGLRYQRLEAEGSGHVIVLERGGRVIGVFCEEHSDNSLWVHPRLLDPELAFEHYVSGTEWNIGGERTWISPEVEYYVADITSFWETYRVQRSIDPGNYQFTSTENESSVTLQQNFVVDAYRAHKQLSLDLMKRIHLVPDPLTTLEAWVPTISYTYVGYSLECTLTNRSEEPVPVSLWNIVQLPAGGEIVISTVDKAVVHDFFMPTGPSHLSVRAGEVRFKLDAQSQHKISIKVSHLTGKAGYIREAKDGRYYLLIRQFDVDPTAEYLDVPVQALTDKGHCVQCYNDNGELGQFGELEFHTPVMDRTQGNRTLNDKCQIWCYSGRLEDMQKIQDFLL